MVFDDAPDDLAEAERVTVPADEAPAVFKPACRRLAAKELCRRPVVKPGSEFELDVDTMIMALGTSPNPLIKNTTKGLETQKWGGIIADEHGQTSREGVFAGGDAVTGAATVILAMGAGKAAAEAMDEYVKNKAVR